MRYTVTMTIYIDAENDKHAVSKAKMIANREQVKYPAQRCEVEKLHCTPFASMNTRESWKTALIRRTAMWFSRHS